MNEEQAMVLADPASPQKGKEALLKDLLGDKVSAATLALLGQAVAGRELTPVEHPLEPPEVREGGGVGIGAARPARLPRKQEPTPHPGDGRGSDGSTASSRSWAWWARVAAARKV